MMNYRLNIICLLFMGYSSAFISFGDEIIAGYRRDFRGQSPLISGWSYLWNSPEEWIPGKTPYNMWSGRIGQIDLYRSMKDAGGVWTADGDRKGENSTPDRHITLNAVGGHPGGGKEVYRNYEGRFAIAAYTISAPGNYALSGTEISVRASDVGDGVELIVHINNDAPLLRRHVASGEKVIFDLPLGTLKSGDTIYVGAGPWIHCYSDAFQWDFSIVRKD